MVDIYYFACKLRSFVKTKQTFLPISRALFPPHIYVHISSSIGKYHILLRANWTGTDIDMRALLYLTFGMNCEGKLVNLDPSRQ